MRVVDAILAAILWWISVQGVREFTVWVRRYRAASTLPTGKGLL